MSRHYVDRLEYDIVAHCNLRCASCSHFSPFFPREEVVVSRFQQDLASLAPLIEARYLKLIGGEPLAHPELLTLMELARGANVAERLMVATNGLLLGRQPDRFWELVDRIELSVYPDSRSRLDIDRLRAQASRFGVDLQVLDIDTFREIGVDHPINDAALTRKIFNTCAHARLCTTVSNGRLYLCPIAAFSDTYLARIGHQTSFRTTDGISLDQPRADLERQLGAYFDRKKPLDACRFCLGYAGVQLAHRQYSAEEINTPKPVRHHEDLLDQRRLNVLQVADTLTRLPRKWLPDRVRVGLDKMVAVMMR